MIRLFLDFLFPPLCKACSEECQTKLLCSSCWEFCSLPDPLHRCRHCFEEVEWAGLCEICRSDPFLFFPSAFVFESGPPSYALCQEGKETPEVMAAFLLVQWERLKWPFPHVVIPLPGAKTLAKYFSLWIGSTYMPILSFCNGLWQCSVEALHEDQIILLLGEQASWDGLKEAALALSESFPRKIYALTLLEPIRKRKPVR